MIIDQNYEIDGFIIVDSRTNEPQGVNRHGELFPTYDPNIICIYKTKKEAQDRIDYNGILSRFKIHEGRIIVEIFREAK